MAWWRQSSLWWLVVANFVPLLGVLFLGWDLFTLLLLYWLESGVVGSYNVLRMRKVDRAGSGSYIFFFLLHYGIFMFVHLVFIFVFFRGGLPLGQILPALIFPLMALVVSHGYSYIANFLRRQEYERRTIKQQLFAPYGRIIVMHFTVILGGWLILAQGQPVGALAVMVGVKIIIDGLSHVRSHGVY